MQDQPAGSESQIRLLESIQHLPKHYRVWACDIWGVLHDGIKANGQASKACSAFRRDHQGIVILITNAPRPFDSVAEQLADFGIPDSAYDAIISSGDVTHHLLQSYVGQSVFHLGPRRDAPILTRAKIKPTDAEQAELILCTGLYDDDREGPEDYRALLQGLAARNLPMICANPDIQVERGNRLVFCAGALAELYSQLGGDIVYAGKPYTPIYNMVREKAAEMAGESIADHQILCIGDGLKTDMAGAFDAGFDALFIASGLHLEGKGALTPTILRRFFAAGKKEPIAAMNGLC